MVAGTLTDVGGCPVSNVTVVFVPAESGDPITVPTDQRGGLAPRKIPPGEYRVYVVEDESSAYLAYDPDFTKAHQNDLPPVTVTPGDTPPLKLALPTKTKDSCQNE